MVGGVPVAGCGLAPSALLKALSAALAYPAQGLQAALGPLRVCAGDAACAPWRVEIEALLAEAEGLCAPAAPQPQGAETAQLEYTRLFIGSFKMYAPPYASYYLDGEQQVQGPTAVELAGIYRMFGLELGAGEHDCPDHLRYLLFFAALLAESCEEGGHEEFAQAYRAFCDDYILSWLPQLQERVQRYAQHPLYPQLLALTSAVLSRPGRKMPARGFQWPQTHE